jgi:hypothetical protein
LGSSKAECWDEGDSSIFKRFEQDRFEPFHSGLATFVDPVTVGTLEHQQIGPFGGDRWIQNGSTP